MIESIEPSDSSPIVKQPDLSSIQRDQIIFWRSVLKNQSTEQLKKLLNQDGLLVDERKAAQELLEDRQSTG